MGDASSTIGDRWHLRTVSDELSGHYRAMGWWNDATLGEMVAVGLGRMGSTPFRVRSSVHPWRGTFAEVDGAARALAGPGPVVRHLFPAGTDSSLPSNGSN